MSALAAGARRSRLEDLAPELRARWAAARVRAVNDAPYLATALLALEPVVVEDLEEAGIAPTALRAFPVDAAWRVHVDPHWLATTPPSTIGFWLVHQVSHLLREHADRFGNVSQEVRPTRSRERTLAQCRWGVAADCEVNDDMPADLRAGGAVVPAALGLPDGLAAEAYWDALVDVSAARLDAALDCGSGADGVTRAWDGDEQGIGGDEGRLIRRETARLVAARVRETGDIPGAWRRWAEQVLEPAVDWRRELSAAMRVGVGAVAGRVDYTYRRPSRRSSAAPGVVMPALHQPVPRVTVVLDTSQSMTGEFLDRAVAEVGGVLRAVGVGRGALRVLCCDVTAHETARTLDARRIELVGGGGTDLRAGLAAAVAQRPRPDLVVVLTDGGTDWPAEPPRGCAVVVGLLDSSRRPPDWARSVDVPVRGA